MQSLRSATTDVLFADPDPALLHVMELVLPRFGYSVQTCCSGRDAVSCLLQHRPDILVLDESFVGSIEDIRLTCGTAVLVTHWSAGEPARRLPGAEDGPRKPYALGEMVAALDAVCVPA